MDGYGAKDTKPAPIGTNPVAWRSCRWLGPIRRDPEPVTGSGSVRSVKNYNILICRVPGD